MAIQRSRTLARSDIKAHARCRWPGSSARLCGATEQLEPLWTGVDRHPDRSSSSDGDEALVDARAVEAGAPDRAVAPVGPVDVPGVDRQRVRHVSAGDETLVDGRAGEFSAPYRAAAGSPVDVAGGDRHHARADAGDEALVDARAVEVGAPDRTAVGVGPVDVRARVRAGRATARSEEHTSELQSLR